MRQVPRGWKPSALLAAALPLAPLLLADLSLFSSGAGLACRVLPNGVVPLLASWSPGCNLEAYDRVLALRTEGRIERPYSAARVAAQSGSVARVELRVSRRGRERWVRVPLMDAAAAPGRLRAVAAALLALGLTLPAQWVRRRSPARAAGPFFGFCLCLGIVSLNALCGAGAPGLELAGVAARGAIPALLVHLALTFPRERGVLRREPGLLRATYGVAVLATAVAAFNLQRSPAVFALVDRLGALASLLVWGAIVIGCVLARRESASPLERARAGALLWGALAAPAVAGGVSVLLGARPPAWSLLAALPAPVGYAILRHRIFDLGLDLRRASAWLVYVALVAVVLLGCAWLASRIPGARVADEPRSFFTAALFGFLLGEPLRGRLRRAIEARIAPAAARLAERAHEHARLSAELHDADACADLLARFACDGLGAGGASVFLAVDGDWRLAHASGRAAATSRRAAAAAARLCRDALVVHLARDDARPSDAARRLRRESVEVVATLRCRGETLGLLLVSPRQRSGAYATLHLRFLDAIARQASVSVHNANLTGGLLEAGRAEALERVGAGLAHDLGKPLGVVECLAGRLPLVLGDRARLERDSRTISVLATEMRTTLRRSVDPGRHPGQRLETLLERAVRAVSSVHGTGRISLRLPPALPSHGGPLDSSGSGEMLTRILINLLDNAVQASAQSDVVELVVSQAPDRLDLEVIDHGCGMGPEVASRAFEPFFTTRPDGEGTGLGLPICRDLVEAIGGDLTLASASGVGTRARVRIPWREARSRDAR